VGDGLPDSDYPSSPTSNSSFVLRGMIYVILELLIEHPYHGMHQISAIQIKVGHFTKEDAVRSKDESARYRQKAAIQIAQLLGNDKRAREPWNKIYQSNSTYHALAMVKNDADNRTGRDLTLDKYIESKDLKTRVPVIKVPPATLQVEVRADCNYKSLPVIADFKNKMSIANDLSAPEIIVAIPLYGKRDFSYWALWALLPGLACCRHPS